jgi:hypothetical protein
VKPFREWKAIYEPLYGPLADSALYRIHLELEDSLDPDRYCRTVPAAAKRALGEYYTPDWLVEMVFDRAGYRRQPMLDPACGAGAFLARAGPAATGWDIHPLAVRMARKRCPAARVELRDTFGPGHFHCEFIAGNPPWVNWRSLGAAYRERIAPLWSRYGLFTRTGIQARLGGAMDDLSGLMTYVCADRYLATEGRLAFLLPAALFHSAGGAAFRRFALPGGAYLRPVSVEEVGPTTAFPGASTRAVIAVFEKSRTPTVYPVPYLRQGLSLEARPVAGDPAAPWSLAPPHLASVFQALRGESPYRARVGVHTGGAAGVFRVEVIEDRGSSLLIRNRACEGKVPYPQVTAEVESALVHPLVRGRDLRDGRVAPSGHILLPHGTGGKPIPEDRMRRAFPLAFAYFEHFREPMLRRPHYLQHFAAAGKPYWSMYNVGPYTFAPHRVAWREQSSTFDCALLAPGHIADAKLVTVAAGSAEEAAWLAGFLRTPLVRSFVDSYVLKTQISTHVMKYLRVPPYPGSVA